MRDENDLEYGIIEIGNTFNEIKPYFIPHEKFNTSGFKYKTTKFFYISPFIDHDSEMDFYFKKEKNNLHIEIIDTIKGQKVLQVLFDGENKNATTLELLKQSLITPFVTFKIIFLIHFHAFILWMKGIRYFKKNENEHLQKGKMRWKM